MQPTRFDLTVREIDELLDELEQLADSPTTPSREFYSKALDRLRHLVSANAALLLYPMVDKALSPLAIVGDCVWSEFSKNLPLNEAVILPSFVNQLGGFVYPVHQATQRAGLLVLTFANSIDEISQRDLSQLCSAFLDVIKRRQQIDNAEVRTEYLPALDQLLANLSNSTNLPELDIQAANDLLVVLQADRVSVARKSWSGSAKVTAVSNHVGKVKNSDAIKEIEAVCDRVIQSLQTETATPNSSQSTESSKLAKFFVALPFKQESGHADSAILIEWDLPDAFLKGSIILRQVVIALTIAWNSQQRWLSIPRALRSFRLVEVRNILPGRLIRPVLGLAVLIGAYWLLTKPYQFRLEIDGAIQPKAQRNVYAMLDGTIDKLQVKDSDRVSKGQILATMKSATLEMQMQEVVGELKAIKEKRDALALSINQLDVNQESKTSMANRLSAETRQLEIQQDTLLRKLQALRAESAKLNIYSPIDGIVVSRDLDKLLDARPVRRGDALFKIIDPQSGLHLHLQVADADIGYLKNKLFPDHGSRIQEGDAARIDIVFVSKPNQSYKANFIWISEVARNPRGDGVFLDALASLDADAVTHAHVGATVKAYANCGERPLWFVFSRPFIETIQRKLWF